MSPKDDEGQECQHDPDTYHLLVGETAENPSKGEPKSVICGSCGKTWSFADHRDAQQLRERVRVLEEALRTRCRYCADGLPRQHYERRPSRYGEKRPHDWGHQYFLDKWEEYAGCKWEDMPSSKQNSATFNEIFPDGIWVDCRLKANEIALLSPAAATEGGEGA